MLCGAQGRRAGGDPRDSLERGGDPRDSLERGGDPRDNYESWSPYTQSAKFQEFHKINVKSTFEYIIGPRNIYVPLDALNMCIFYFGLPGNDCTKDDKTAEEVGLLVVQSLLPNKDE